MPLLAKKGNKEQDILKSILPKSLNNGFGYHRLEDEKLEDYEKRIQQIADAYNKALTSTPDPDTLHQPDWDSKDYDFTKSEQNRNLNLATIQGWEDAAKKSRAWVGRTLTDGVGDGYAIYVVVKENKKSVRIKVCRGVGDDWTSRHWGEECSIDKVEACTFMEWRIGQKRELPYDMKEK